MRIRLLFVYGLFSRFPAIPKSPFYDFVRIVITQPDNTRPHITCALEDGKFQNDPSRITAVFHCSRTRAQSPISYWRVRRVRNARESVRDRKSGPRLEFFITIDSLFTRSHVVRCARYSLVFKSRQTLTFFAATSRVNVTKRRRQTNK